MSFRATSTSRRGHERALLRQRPFRLLWTGQALSAVGDRLIIVALPLLVAGLTRSAGSVGLVIACHGLALLVGLPVGGVIADRMPRQRVMLGADLVRAGVHAGVAVLVLAGAANLPLLI